MARTLYRTSRQYPSGPKRTPSPPYLPHTTTRQHSQSQTTLEMYRVRYEPQNTRHENATMIPVSPSKHFRAMKPPFLCNKSCNFVVILWCLPQPQPRTRDQHCRTPPSLASATRPQPQALHAPLQIPPCNALLALPFLGYSLAASRLSAIALHTRFANYSRTSAARSSERRLLFSRRTHTAANMRSPPSAVGSRALHLRGPGPAALGLVPPHTPN